jgi:hypothetical protein
MLLQGWWAVTFYLRLLLILILGSVAPFLLGFSSCEAPPPPGNGDPPPHPGASDAGTPKPTITIRSPGDAATLDSGCVDLLFTDSFVPNADGGALRYSCSVDGKPLETCEPAGTRFCNLTEGEHDVSVRSWTHSTGQAQVSFRVDVPPNGVDETPPIVIITEPVNGQTLGWRYFSVHFVASEHVRGWQCQTDSEPWRRCAFGEHLFLENGAHTLRVRTTDLAGNQGFASTELVMDATDIHISAPMDGSVVGSGCVDLAFTPYFPSWTLPSAPVNYWCSVDWNRRAPCSTGQRLCGLTEGQHSLQIQGSTSDSSWGASRTIDFSVDQAPTGADTTPPIVSISSPTNDAVLRLTDPINPFVEVTFSVTELSETRCRADQGEWETCTAPQSVRLPGRGTSGGAHRLEVEATDESGNVGSASVTVLVDEPGVVVSSPLAGARVTGTCVDLGFTAYVPTWARDVTYECSLDGKDIPCAPGRQRHCGLTEGHHWVSVNQVVDFGHPFERKSAQLFTEFTATK